MKRARIGVCGAGWWGQGWHLPHLDRNPLAQISAIVEPASHPRSSNASEILDTRAKVGARYGAPTFESIDDLLSSHIQLDGLLIATPHASHFELASKAIAANLHVMLEKPMTTDVEEAQNLARAARTSKKAFMVNNTANWRPQVLQPI
jgi:predicted dehydrogenase